MVGDSVDADIEGALAIGMRAVFLDRHNLVPDYAPRIEDLYQLATYLDEPVSDTHLS
jgi:FMN phosphatase YigB (HAD superfamily)